MAKNLNLDVDSPDKIPGILDNAVNAFHESAAELNSGWQDKTAGAPWKMISGELAKAEQSIRRKLRDRYGYSHLR